VIGFEVGSRERVDANETVTKLWREPGPLNEGTPRRCSNSAICLLSAGWLIDG
jgi:hypothetical protein